MIRIFFGNPGCGKTTLACRLLRKHQKKMIKKKSPYRFLYANFENKISSELSLDGLGEWTPSPFSYLIVDEAGIQYNSRKYKSLSQEAISWFKLHRHYQCDVDFISQSWEDIDITIRRLAEQLWYVRRLGPFTMIRRIYKRVGINSDTHQIEDYYEFGKLLPCLLPPPFHRDNCRIFLRKPYYKYFDTYSRKYLPIKTANGKIFDPKHMK